MRSAAPWTSGRQEGGVTLKPGALPSTVKPSFFSVDTVSAFVNFAPESF